MAETKILVLLLSVLTVQGAVLRHEDAVQSRVARSPCYSCGYSYGPVFSSRQWTGYSRSADGYRHGIFSGAAAASGSGDEASGNAFSLAATDADSGANNGQTNTDQSAKFAAKYSHGDYSGNTQNSQSTLDGVNSASLQESSSGYSDRNAQTSGNSNTQSSNVGNGFQYGQSASSQLQDNNGRNFGKNTESNGNSQVGGQEQIQDTGLKSLFGNTEQARSQGQYHSTLQKSASVQSGEFGDQEYHHGSGENKQSINRGDIVENNDGGDKLILSSPGRSSGQQNYQGSGQQNIFNSSAEEKTKIQHPVSQGSAVGGYSGQKHKIQSNYEQSGFGGQSSENSNLQYSQTLNDNLHAQKEENSNMQHHGSHNSAFDSNAGQEQQVLLNAHDGFDYWNSKRTGQKQETQSNNARGGLGRENAENSEFPQSSSLGSTLANSGKQPIQSNSAQGSLGKQSAENSNIQHSSSQASAYDDNAYQKEQSNIEQSRFGSRGAKNYGGQGHGQYQGYKSHGGFSNGGSGEEYGKVQEYGSQFNGGYGRRAFGRSDNDANDKLALNGALDLASQGLKTTEGAQAACSTCGKNSYAISNARSHSGSAIALSVGG